MSAPFNCHGHIDCIELHKGIDPALWPVSWSDRNMKSHSHMCVYICCLSLQSSLPVNDLQKIEVDKNKLNLKKLCINLMALHSKNFTIRRIITLQSLRALNLDRKNPQQEHVEISAAVRGRVAHWVVTSVTSSVHIEYSPVLHSDV